MKRDLREVTEIGPSLFLSVYFLMKPMLNIFPQAIEFD